MSAERNVLRIGFQYKGLFAIAGFFGALAGVGLLVGLRGGEGLILTVFFGVGAGLMAVVCLVYGLILRRHRATALRLDTDGLSGFVLKAPLRWADIRLVGKVVVGRDGQWQVALSLADPAAYEGKIDTMLQPQDPDEPWHYHVLIPGGLERDNFDLFRILTEWHGRYGGDQTAM